nr:helix-turn-helix transcriptional regulator [Actinotalea subterranea]
MGRSSAQGRRNGVRVARTLRGMTQAELAAEVGVSRQTVVALESGDYAPSVYLALAISRCLGATVEQLFAEDAAAEEPARGQSTEVER